MKLTKPQHAALMRIAREPEGSMPLRWIEGRMVNCYRVARSLEDKGLVTRKNAGRDSGDYLYITDAGRAVLYPQPPACNAGNGLACPDCGSTLITTVSGQGLRATCRECGRAGGDHEFVKSGGA